MIALLDKISQEEKDRGVAICGDLIDRGPKSKQVVQWCIDNKVSVVAGNHEEMMIDESDSIIEKVTRTGRLCDMYGSLWTLNGGLEALHSYETVDPTQLDDRGCEKRIFDLETFKEHVEWMKTLPYYIEYKNLKNEDGRYLVLSHSNIGNVWHLKDNKGKVEQHNFKSQTTWGRPRQIKDVKSIYNVIGHTPQENGPRIRKIFANIDTGGFYNHPNFYRLTALQFPEMIIYSQENIDE